MAIANPSQQTLDFIRQPVKLFINNEFVASDSGAMLELHNPASGEHVASVMHGSIDEMERAVAAARLAFDDSPWSRMRPRERQNLLWRLSDLMERDAQILAELECLNNGKSAAVARAMDVQLAIDFFRYMAGWATKIGGSTVQPSVPLMPDAHFHGFTCREPMGVVGAIVAWNFPLLLACWKIAPALATGCTIVLKPADETPLSVLKLAELVKEAGYPAGVVNIITGTGSEVGDALSRHPDVNKLTFTGSTRVGQLIGCNAMQHMTRVTLELGGKSPVIILEDANLDEAIAGAAQAIFFNHGQVCSAGSRLYVQRSIYDKVTEGIAEIARQMKLGNGMDPEVAMGPMISEKQQKTVQRYIDTGRNEGARILCGGESFGPGYFVKPTVVVDVEQESTLVQEEIFGPVLVCIPFDTPEEAVRLANDNVYGLGASIWSNNLSTVHRMIPQIKAGSVWVNCHNPLDPSVPFGGYKLSGIGREMGEEVIAAYTEHKSVVIKA